MSAEFSIPDFSRCRYPGCDFETPDGSQLPFFDGKPYCGTHYRQALEDAFKESYSEWESETPPSQKFKTFFSRIFEELGWAVHGDSYLSKARIRDRGFDFEKTPTGCTFKIVRHPGAWQPGGSSERVTQTWEADFQKRELHLVSTRPFADGDFDP